MSLQIQGADQAWKNLQAWNRTPATDTSEQIASRILQNEDTKIIDIGNKKFTIEKTGKSVPELINALYEETLHPTGKPIKGVEKSLIQTMDNPFPTMSQRVLKNLNLVWGKKLTPPKRFSEDLVTGFGEKTLKKFQKFTEIYKKPGFGPGEQHKQLLSILQTLITAYKTYTNAEKDFYVESPTELQELQKLLQENELDAVVEGRKPPEGWLNDLRIKTSRPVIPPTPPQEAPKEEVVYAATSPLIRQDESEISPSQMSASAKTTSLEGSKTEGLSAAEEIKRAEKTKTIALKVLYGTSFIALGALGLFYSKYAEEATEPSSQLTFAQRAAAYSISLGMSDLVSLLPKGNYVKYVGGFVTNFVTTCLTGMPASTAAVQGVVSLGANGVTDLTRLGLTKWAKPLEDKYGKTHILQSNLVIEGLSHTAGLLSAPLIASVVNKGIQTYEEFEEKRYTQLHPPTHGIESKKFAEEYITASPARQEQMKASLQPERTPLPQQPISLPSEAPPQPAPLPHTAPTPTQMPTEEVCLPEQAPEIPPEEVCLPEQAPTLFSTTAKTNSIPMPTNEWRITKAIKSFGWTVYKAATVAYPKEYTGQQAATSMQEPLATPPAGENIQASK